MTYIINDNVLTTYIPVETMHSGRHILNLYYPLSGLDANAYNTFRVRMRISGGSAFIDRGQAIATISGQGLSSNNVWDGRLEFTESEFHIIPAAGSMSIRRMSASAAVHKEAPRPAGIHESFMPASLASYGIMGMKETAQVNPVVVTEIIETADRDEMDFDRYFVKTDAVFELNTEYDFVNRESRCSAFAPSPIKLFPLTKICDAGIPLKGNQSTPSNVMVSSSWPTLFTRCCIFSVTFSISLTES